MSGQVQFYSWIFLIAYFIYHSKLGFSFLKTFIDLMKDKEEANEIEQNKRQITSKDEYMVMSGLQFNDNKLTSHSDTPAGFAVAEIASCSLAVVNAALSWQANHKLTECVQVKSILKWKGGLSNTV